ncbi:FxsA family protein [Bacillus taeanensis]|uniref:Membrane protein FxsA n=1 Tax=Bacillus taeanensis TaxID=273032 RepID=A0A366Y274_9BACI|nr:FxsA family protein [Bacillus taeanensis]RBW71485.1 membrane protein FxsA [Bacillus taeanensis]
MFRMLLAFIIIIPAMEIGLLLLSGKTLGVWPTIVLIIMTGVLGAWLAKKEGAQALKLAQIQVQNGEIPNEVILDGLCILVGGVVLLTPGFITDAAGFFLLVPTTRTIAKAGLRKLISRMIQNGQFTIIKR